MGPGNQGHVRYPLYNAFKNETLKKKNRVERENLMGKPPPQNTMHEERTKEVTKQFFPSLQGDPANVQAYAR
jgi:hypothetical protein